jgi:hypothetical protein
VRAYLGVEVFEGEQQPAPYATGRRDVASYQRHPKRTDAQTEMPRRGPCIDVKRSRRRRADRRTIANEVGWFSGHIAIPPRAAAATAERRAISLRSTHRRPADDCRRARLGDDAGAALRRSHRQRVEHGALRAGTADRVDREVEDVLDVAPRHEPRWLDTDVSVMVPAQTAFVMNTVASLFRTEAELLLSSKTSKSSQD